MASSDKKNLQKLKTKIMQLLLKNFATAGISSELAMQPYPSNEKILMGFSILCISIFCIFEPFFHESKTSFEYTISSCAGSYVILIMSALLIIVLKVGKLFELIRNCETVVNLSEYRIPKLLFQLLVEFISFLEI